MTSAKTSSAATTVELLARLQRHYIDPTRDTPGGVFITEVGSNGSAAIATRCDALYIGFTTASQRILVGHELKVSRSDWLAEIGRKTGKADAWADQCHQWYVVVPDPAIVRDDELPDGWGLMTPGRGNRMTVHTRATIKTDRTPSWDAVRSIFARYDTLRAQALIAGDADRMAKAHEKARKEAAQAFQRRLDAQRGPEAATVAKQIIALEEALGAPIDWDSDEQPPRSGHIGFQALRDIAALVKAYGSVTSAAQVVTSRYRNPITHVRGVADALAAALDEVAAVALGDPGERPQAEPAPTAAAG